MSRVSITLRALIALVAVGAAALPTTAQAYWRGGVWFGVAPIVPFYPPVYLAPPVVYAPPPVVYTPPGFAVTPPGFVPPGYGGPGSNVLPQRSAEGASCYAGAYVCPLRNETPLGGACSCPGNSGRVPGTVR